MSSRKFTTEGAIDKLMVSMEHAINNMIEEVKKPVDPEAGGAARKAELQSIKQTAVDCQELIKKYHELSEMKKQLKENGSIKEEQDYSGGWAEKYSK